MNKIHKILFCLLLFLPLYVFGKSSVSFGVYELLCEQRIDPSG